MARATSGPKTNTKTGVDIVACSLLVISHPTPALLRTTLYTVEATCLALVGAV